MPEAVEEQAEQGLDLQRFVSVARRRHIQFLVPAFLGWLIVWGSSWFLPARYKSGTMILVEQPALPRNYVVPNVNDDLQDRLQSIKQQVLSRSRLLQIIAKFHLYQGGRRHLTPDEMVESMGKDIDIELVRDQRRDQITAFSISYSARDPHTAQAVATELTQQFINENLKVRQEESESTTDFIKKQADLKAKELADQEEKVKEFQAAHQGELPTQQASNLQILGGFQQQLQNAQDQLNAANQQRAFLETEISNFRATHATARTADGAPTGLAAIDQQMDQLKSRLADLLSTHTDKYPDVIAAKDQLAKLGKQRDAMVAAMAANPNTDAAQDSGDPVADAQLLQLKGQLKANQLEIANREKAIADLNEKISEYRTRLNAEPATEQQLDELTRGQEESRKDYDDLLKKESDSEQATSMEQMQQGERFTMLDPATVPLKPDFPNRLKFCGMGLGAGIALGLVIVVVLELLDGRLHTENEIRALLPVSVISEIPQVSSPSDERIAKRRTVVAWVATGFVVMTILAGSAFSYLHP
jgi:polysaccharide biosynthesis transport protein